MTTTEIIEKITELQELEDMLHELNAEIDSIKDSLKQELNEQHSEELVVGTHIIRYTTVISNRFNSTEFKKVMPDVYKAYLIHCSMNRKKSTPHRPKQSVDPSTTLLPLGVNA